MRSPNCCNSSRWANFLGGGVPVGLARANQQDPQRNRSPDKKMNCNRVRKPSASTSAAVQDSPLDVHTECRLRGGRWVRTTCIYSRRDGPSGGQGIVESNSVLQVSKAIPLGWLKKMRGWGFRPLGSISVPHWQKRRTGNHQEARRSTELQKYHPGTGLAPQPPP